MKRIVLMMLGLAAGIMCAKAQIGYQVSLLNTATGEARANETVTVTVSFSNCEGKVFYSETKSALTNDFGVLSLTIGNADTFKNVDLSKMPFYIETSANGVMIGKSQILSVPVAEVAKQVAPLDKSVLVGTWRNVKSDEVSFTFNEDGTGLYYDWGSRPCTYVNEGNFVLISYTANDEGHSSTDYLFLMYFNGFLIPVDIHPSEYHIYIKK